MSLNMNFDKCSFITSSALRAPYEVDVEVHHCYSVGLREAFSLAFGARVPQPDGTTGAALVDRGSYLETNERVAWWAMFHFLERSFAGADASIPTTETCAIQYFFEHMPDIYDNVSHVSYLTKVDCYRKLDSYLEDSKNQAKVKVISDLFPSNLPRQSPNGLAIELPGDANFRLDHRGLFAVLSAACQQPHICAGYAGFSWIIDATAWLLFSITFAGSNNVNRFRKLISAGVGPNSSKTVKAPADGAVFSSMQTVLVGHLSRDKYAALLTQLDVLVNTLPPAYQGMKNMLNQCKFNGMTGFVIVQECLQAHMGDFPFEVLIQVWAQEYSDMCAAFKAASLPNGDLNPYYMFALGSEKTEYTATKFKRFVIVCSQIQIQVDGKQSIAQYARGRNMNELGSYQAWVQTQIDSMKKNQTGLLDGSISKAKMTYNDFLKDVNAA